MSIDATKPVLRASDEIIQKPAFSDRIVKSRLEQVKYDSVQFVNSKDADQTARMRKLVCAFVVCRPRWHNSLRTFSKFRVGLL